MSKITLVTVPVHTGIARNEKTGETSKEATTMLLAYLPDTLGEIFGIDCDVMKLIEPFRWMKIRCRP